MKLTDNFSLIEFRSKDGAEFPVDVVDNLKILAFNLQALRDEIDSSIKINSGWRSVAHTEKLIGQGVKTSLKSYHVKGMAADIKSLSHTPRELFDIIEGLQKRGLMHDGGLKAYNTFVHYDIGPKRRW